MKKLHWLFVAALSLAAVVMFPDRTVAAAETYSLKMWIAPLECTRSQVVDGVTVRTIITPAECDDLLNPPAGPSDPPPRPSSNGKSPTAPDTGVFSDVWTMILGVATLLFILGSTLYILRREILTPWLRKHRG